MTTKNRIRARSALREISDPHEGPTSVTATSSALMPAASARAVRTAAVSSGPDVVDCTRTVSSPTVWIRASAWPRGRSRSRTSPTDNSPEGTSQAVPPSKSMPCSTPRRKNEATLSTISTAETGRAMRQPRTKL
jgi:hypothetical protein